MTGNLACRGDDMFRDLRQTRALKTGSGSLLGTIGSPVRSAGSQPGARAISLGALSAWAVLLSVLLSTGAGTWAQTFDVLAPVEPRIPLGGMPVGLTPCDVNRDGVKDLAIPHHSSLSSGSVSVLLGRGGGGFDELKTYSVESFPGAVVVGDFNRDGFDDLVMVHTEIRLLVGDGTGSFRDPVHIELRDAPWVEGLIAADFNGDGSLDLAFADSSAFLHGAVALALGDGLGGFGGERWFPAGERPVALAALDADGDGAQDLAVANSQGGDVSILLGDGSGGFGDPIQYATGEGPCAVLASDVDEDGDPDLVVANADSDDVTVLSGDGAGGFLTPRSLAAGNGPTAMAVDDLDGDGHPDLVVVSSRSDSAFVFLGDGKGGFSAPQRFPVGGVPSAVAVLEAGGDGALDIVTANFSTADLSILVGEGAGGFAGPQTTPAGEFPLDFVSADFDGDGLQDLAVFDGDEGRIIVLLGDGKGGFRDTNCPVDEAGTWQIAVADFDGDSFQDLATLSVAGDLGAVAVKFADGAGGFGAPEIFQFEDTPDLIPTSLAATHFNNDGFGDLAILMFDVPTIVVLLGDGAGGFRAPSFFDLDLFEVDILAGPKVADFNADRFEDLAVWSRDADAVVVLIGDGAGGFSERLMYNLQDLMPFGNLSDIVVSDFNDDRVSDIAAAATEFGGGAIGILWGDGMGHFTGPQVVPVDCEPVSLSVSDFDTDGVQDLAVGCRGSIKILRGPVSESLWGPRIPVPGTGEMVRAVDLTADGVADLVSLSKAGIYAALNTSGSAVPFLRGNVNADPRPGLDISDPIFTIQYLFYGERAPTCLDSADSNDDGDVDISDPIHLLMFLFIGGGRPGPPFETCGVDPTADDLGCESYPLCR